MQIKEDITDFVQYQKISFQALKKCMYNLKYKLLIIKTRSKNI